MEEYTPLLTGKDFGEVKMDTTRHSPRKAAFQVLCWIERILNLFVWERTKLNCLSEKVKKCNTKEISNVMSSLASEVLVLSTRETCWNSDIIWDSTRVQLQSSHICIHLIYFAVHTSQRYIILLITRSNEYHYIWGVSRLFFCYLHPPYRKKWGLFLLM